MSNSEEESGYDLKKSTKLIGYLYPILRAADGSLLDGKHRAHADSSWRTEVLENIDSEEKKLAARLIANIHRRTVPREEKERLINSLAKLYQEQGLKVNPLGSHKSNEIADKIAEVTGLHVQTVRRYLSQDFKNKAQGSGTLGKGFVSAEKAIMSRIGSQQRDYGKRLIQRFKAEYKAELLSSEEFLFKIFNSCRYARSYRKIVEANPQCEVIGIQEDVNKLGLSGDKNGDPVGIKKRGRPKLPKGEGLPKKEQTPEILNDSYYEMFTKECPGCLCSSCPHAMECIERVMPDEEPMLTRLRLRTGNK